MKVISIEGTRIILLGSGDPHTLARRYYRDRLDTCELVYTAEGLVLREQVQMQGWVWNWVETRDVAVIKAIEETQEDLTVSVMPAVTLRMPTTGDDVLAELKSYDRSRLRKATQKNRQ